MRCYVLGVHHVPTSLEFASDPFVANTLNLCRLLCSRGHEVIHLGVAGSAPVCTQNVDLISKAEWEKAFGPEQAQRKLAYMKAEGPAFADYLDRYHGQARRVLRLDKEAYTSIVCLPYGAVQSEAVKGISQFAVESGVGYPHTNCFSRYRVFPSYAYLHFVKGLEHGVRNVPHGYAWYDAVIPHPIDLDLFDYNPGPRENYFLYMGRIQEDKGVRIAVDVTKRMGVKLLIVGSGDASPFTKGQYHVTHIPAVGWEERKAYMSAAQALFCPTYYTEPFGLVAIEAQACFPFDVKIRAKRVEKLYSRVYTGTLLKVSTNVDEVECTPTHPFLTRRGWIAASDLRASDELVRRVGHEEPSPLDTERIGSVVSKLSKNGTCFGSEGIESSNIGCGEQGKTIEATPRSPTLFHSERDCNYSSRLRTAWCKSSWRNSETSSKECSEESILVGIKNTERLEVLYWGSHKVHTVRVCNAWRNSAWEETGILRASRDGKSDEIGHSVQHGIAGYVLACNDDLRRTSVLCRSHRRRRHDNLKESFWAGKKEEQKYGSYRISGEHFRCDHPVDQGENRNSECGLVLTSCQGKVLLEREPTSIHDDIHQRFQLFAVVQGATALSCNEETTHGIADRMGRGKAETGKSRRALQAHEAIGADDSIYEFTRIRSITHREVARLPVYNLGTRTGVYEANGLVVHNCGTPVISTDWGAFAETVVHGVTGYRCRTGDQFGWAAANVHKLLPHQCRQWIEANFSLEKVGLMYEEYFQSLLDLKKDGWNTLRPGRTQLSWLEKQYP